MELVIESNADCGLAFTNGTTLWRAIEGDRVAYLAVSEQHPMGRDAIEKTLREKLDSGDCFPVSRTLSVVAE